MFGIGKMFFFYGKMIKIERFLFIESVNLVFFYVSFSICKVKYWMKLTYYFIITKQAIQKN
jgi:hypothetical protein